MPYNFVQSFKMRLITNLCAVLMVFVPAFCLAQNRTISINPSKTDSAIHDFDDANLIIIPKDSPPSAPLVVFLPGTSGKPEYSKAFFNVIADQGYKVIGLEYNDIPAVAQVCPKDPDPDCSEKFRAMRIYGKGPASVNNPPAESINNRLFSLLKELQAENPNDGWDKYIDNNQPNWSNIIISGLSQGAGMAAYIAKNHKVARVVLFSSPWDFTGTDRHPAPWLIKESATPMNRWYAEYNARELTANIIKTAYEALKIPPDHIKVFSLDLPADFHGNSLNPYHGITIRDMRYADDWKEMFGTPQISSAPK